MLYMRPCPVTDAARTAGASSAPSASASSPSSRSGSSSPATERRHGPQSVRLRVPRIGPRAPRPPPPDERRSGRRPPPGPRRPAAGSDGPPFDVPDRGDADGDDAPAIDTLTGYRWPIANARLTLPFGPTPWGGWIVEGDKFHDGIDLATFCGDKVYSAHDGVVLAAGRRYDDQMGWIG